MHILPQAKHAATHVHQWTKLDITSRRPHLRGCRMRMHIAPTFLNHLRSIYPSPDGALDANNGINQYHVLAAKTLSPCPVIANPWYIVASVAFSGSNDPTGAASVFQYVLEDIRAKGGSIEQEKLLARRIRDALFKSGLATGYPKVINSLIALHEVTPEELRDMDMMRDPETSIEQHKREGEKFFETLYGDTAGPVQGILDTIYPDMGWFSKTIGYGLTYGFTSLLSPKETSYVLVAGLISADVPRQINWHLAGAQRNGASQTEVKAVRQIAIDACSHVGVNWKEGVPEVANSVENQDV